MDSAASITADKWRPAMEKVMWVVFFEVGIVLALVLTVLWALRPRADADDGLDAGEGDDR
ncbi:MAG: hypothetical protein LBT71_06500 [Azoarcus sp.]|jgi:heme/copper-type cytochrome/quinol oxidase subunit 2|nr:hypothetical protein [Azoarcus sp.]